MANEEIDRDIYELFLSSRIRQTLRSGDFNAASEIFRTHSNSLLYGLVCQPRANISLGTVVEEEFPAYGRFAQALRTERNAMLEKGVQSTFTFMASAGAALGAYQIWPDSEKTTQQVFTECAANPNGTAFCPPAFQEALQESGSFLLALTACALAKKFVDLRHERNQAEKRFEAVCYEPPVNPS